MDISGAFDMLHLVGGILRKLHFQGEFRPSMPLVKNHLNSYLVGKSEDMFKNVGIY